MLMASSPIAFPQSSPPPARRKRDGPHEKPKPAKPVVRAGFLGEDDSDDDDDHDHEAAGPPSKKRMLDQPATPTSLDAATDVATEGVDEETQGIPDAQLASESQQVDETQTQSELFFNPSSYPSLLESWKARDATAASLSLSTCSGRSIPIRQRAVRAPVPYENMVAARSRTKEGRAKRSYYGVDIHELMDGAKKELAESAAAKKAQEAVPAVTAEGEPIRSVEVPDANPKRPKKCQLWTEKYRARNFMDLVGDDLTHRQVLRWLKRWDPVVFPNSARSRTTAMRRPGAGQQPPQEEKPLRKILMLTGPPGLGKTTLAHVCARQAGYGVLEINASDDRSRDVVRGRIRTCLGTESVKTVEHTKPQPGKQQKVARPVCVVVDEVDGVVSGAGASGEGGFVKALIDLVLTDQKNASEGGSSTAGRRKKKGDDFRQMRPLVLICNDVYHASLRPLRQSGLAEIIHVGKPPLDAVVLRLKTVFEKEGIPCEKEAARKLCEAAWGMTSGIDARRGAESTAEGDLRGVMVVGEWVAGRFKAAASGGHGQLTRHWIEQNIMRELAHGGGGARGIGRGSVKEISARIFQEGAGFPKQNLATTQSKKTRHEQPKTQLSFSEHQKRYGMARLGEMIQTSGEVDRIMTEVFLEYPNREYNDDCYLTKPNAAYEWMHFHDTCSHRVYASQEWELGQYFSQPVLACHHLFASPHRHVPTAGYDRKWGMDAEEEAAQQQPLPFSGPRADFLAREAEKENRAVLQTIQAQLSPSLTRAFRSPEDISTDFLPYLVRLVSPDVKPVLVGGSDKYSSIASVRREAEKIMVRRAAEVLAEVGISLLKGKIEEANPSAGSRPQWVYRMEPSVPPPPPL